MENGYDIDPDSGLTIEENFDNNQNARMFSTFDVSMLGSGTLEDPYQVSNKEELKNIEKDMNAHYLLTSDINLEGEIFSPIGYGASETSYTTFLGTLDGQNHKISNFKR